MKKNLPIVILASLILISAAGFLLIRGSNHGNDLIQMREVSAPETATTSVAATTTAADVPKPIAQSISTAKVASQGKRQYSKKAFHFSFLYPENLQVQEYKEQGGGFTVTFEDTKANQEFQVYVTPYSGGQISEAQFKLDEPSGVRKNQTDVVVDGARGIMFFSTNAIMGDTREVWFIHSGYLYEITTFKEFDAWLAQIMQTWKFLN